MGEALAVNCVFYEEGNGCRIPLRLQIAKATIAISAEPEKGAADEENALAAIERLEKLLAREGVFHRSDTRRVGGRERVDKVVILMDSRPV